MSGVDIFWLAAGGLITLLLVVAVSYWIAQEARGDHAAPPRPSPSGEPEGGGDSSRPADAP